jgi:hypothetical protein
MTCSIKKLSHEKLVGSDGQIGHVHDFYFDDQTWAVRYVVADTGNWLPGRQVLLSPHAFGNLGQPGKPLPVNLTRKQIENSPSMDLHKPVSRQFEEEYYRYYGWPNYWEGEGLWGMSGFPILTEPPKTIHAEPSRTNGPHPKGPDAHLRSTRAVHGYHIKASDGMSGHVCDFMIDARSWAIVQLVVKTGHRFSGKKVEIPTSKVERISYEESTVFVSLSVEAVERSLTHDTVPAAA